MSDQHNTPKLTKFWATWERGNDVTVMFAWTMETAQRLYDEDCRGRGVRSRGLLIQEVRCSKLDGHLRLVVREACDRGIEGIGRYIMGVGYRICRPGEDEDIEGQHPTR
ncbi:hypothetical protein [Sphingomonas jatrophae]|uniref:Uncharacterized protein n=1 Tax=Sphingomonas jatrophae TaxID=1166337 RepID=A0A1I6L1D4_9SPHN|nr:hypothetical protein [Sphingomonas jatrophae]SFR97242.1 hypothetical protein SAMN05192580_2141 [Sphingomonas jatrophae]